MYVIGMFSKLISTTKTTANLSVIYGKLNNTCVLALGIHQYISKLNMDVFDIMNHNSRS